MGYIDTLTVNVRLKLLSLIRRTFKVSIYYPGLQLSYFCHGMNNNSRIKLWLTLLDILFPESCLGCGSGLKGRQAVSYCQECLAQIRIIQEPYCTRCGRPFDKSAGGNHLCSRCLTKGWYFSRARAAVCYKGPLAEAVKLFKYHGKMYGLDTFAVLTRQFYDNRSQPAADLILPVPLHAGRLRKRGFNQALILTRKFFPEQMDKIDPFVLERHRGTAPQTGLSGAARCKNVRNAFRVTRPEKIKNKKILLVDDVFTTGATVNECARVLLKNQASEVEIFTFARAGA